MKIFNEFYLITLPIILIGTPLLFYIKLSQPNPYTYNIVIYGDTISSSMLAYYIDQQIQDQFKNSQKIIKFNITLISSSEIASLVVMKQNLTEINKKIYSFCGVQRQFMKLIEKTNLKYNIKEYGIYFGQILEGVDKNQFQIYTRQASFFNTFSKYGLSNYAANNFFTQFSKNINRPTQQAQNSHHYRLQEMTTLNIIKKSFPSSIQQNGLAYFSQKLGLDLSYIHSFIFPVIWGNYFHQPNSLSTFYKLLSTYCHKKPQMGKSLVIFQQPNKIKEKILSMVSFLNINFIPNKIIETYSIIKNNNDRNKYIKVGLNNKNNQTSQLQQYINVNDTLRTYINCDILFIFQKTENMGGKTYSYYKTIIDGKIKNQELYQEFFTIYMKVTGKKKQQQTKQQAKKQKAEVNKATAKGHGFNPIYSITRVCALNCKGYDNSVYILISKHKLASSKNLQMFQSHQIKYFKKLYIQKSQMPTNNKLQQNQNVFKIYDIDSISDNYEVQLNFVKEISESFIRKIKNKYKL